MARPHLEVGTAGKPKVTPQVCVDGKWLTLPEGDTTTKPDRWRARVSFRDHDGVTRSIERFDTNKSKAETKLKAALRDRTTPHDGDLLRPGMLFGDAGQVWLEQLARSDRAESTVKQYADNWARYVKGSTFTQFTLAEANRVPRVRAFLQKVADERGHGSAKTAKTLVSLVLGLAVTDGLFETNAVQQLRGTPKPAGTVVKPLSARDKALIEAGWTREQIQPDHSLAFTADQRAALVAKVRVDSERSGFVRTSDVADLVAFMAAIGCRIDEALHVRWEGVTFGKSTVWVPGTKTETSDRTLVVASWAMDVLRERHRLEGQPAKGFVFHGPRGGLESERGVRNASRALRRVFDDAGHPWAIPHTFRRTVATLLDERGVPLAQIADYLGHADPSMTARVYLGRKVDTSKAAAAL